MTFRTYQVIGLTCGRCEQSVTSELLALDAVEEVLVDLVAGGTSLVTVTSSLPLDEGHLVSALEQAGDYRLAQPSRTSY